MEQFFDKIYRFVVRFGESSSSFSTETWLVLATMTLIGGYFLLKGNAIRGG